MKLLSMKSILGLIAVLLVAGAWVFFASGKEALIPQSNAAENTEFEAIVPIDASDIATVEPVGKPLPFDFNFIVTKCSRKATQPKVTLKVAIKDYSEPTEAARPPRYTYQWIVNGAVVSTDSELSCFCANSVTLILTRTSDNHRVGKSIRLWVCNSKEPEADNEEK